MSENKTRRLNVIQNLSWIDRVIRYIVGTALVTVPLTVIGVQIPSMQEGASVSTGWYVLLLLALYPFWTATVGWDPIYRLFNVRSCGGSENNPCGTLPYELDAAAGREPIPESDYQHNLGSAHHPGEKGAKPQQQQYGNRGRHNEPHHAPG